jgi:5-methylcytosine-specific restriction endonuclease McrA
MRSRSYSRGSVSKIRRTREQVYGTQHEWDYLSREVALRDKVCQRCGRTPQEVRAQGKKMRAHHIIPASKGGRTVLANLKYLCDDCHELQPGHSHLRGHHGRR